MGADIKQLRMRIKSVDSTLHLTKAMGLVASSKIRRATDSMNKGKEYARAFEEIISLLASLDECKKNPYMSTRKGDKVCLIVRAGDRGLAGGYNANIFRLLKQYPNASVIPIGKRACERFGGVMRFAEDYSYADAISLANDICRDFTEEKFDKFGILCTKYNSMMSQDAYVKWILPLSLSAEGKKENALFEPDELTVLNSIIPDYIAGSVNGKLCERDDKSLVVSLGFFSVVRIERPAQLLINAVEYNIPDKECIAAQENDPCTLFKSMAFPIDEFSPSIINKYNNGCSHNIDNHGKGNCGCH